jgi:hypothetical protein
VNFALCAGNAHNLDVPNSQCSLASSVRCLQRMSPCTQIPDSRLLILKSFPVFNCKLESTEIIGWGD